MFDYLIRKIVAQRAQKDIDKLEPKVNVRLPLDLPLPSTKAIKQMCATVSNINSLESKMKSLSDEALRQKTVHFRQGFFNAVAEQKKIIAEIESHYSGTVDPEEKKEINLRLDQAYEALHKKKQQYLREILPEAFALVREASFRVLGMRHFDVQMIGGMVLNSGGISEMTTGEGKTLVATLAAYLNAIPGEGVHVVTVNDYLARRDCEWMGPIYEFLGLTVGVIQHDMMPAERKVSYACDIVYGTNNEFGFDYLRDNMVSYHEDMVQRKHHFAIVDEVDSILIDEARTPLIISGPAEESTDKYYRADVIARKVKGRRITDKEEIDAKYNNVNLAEGYDYLAEEKGRSVSLTEEGEAKIAQMFGIANLHDMETIEYRHHILQAIRAHEFFKQDVDYVIREGQVIIVDEFTGRLMPGRRWSDGLHQAVEAKEGIKIERENQTLATITLQNYFRMYEKLSGMTGTAYTEAAEFKHIYDLDVITIPTNKPMQRKNFSDAVYRSEREKFNAVVDDIAAAHKNGQPVLVGTISIEKSERLSRMLQQRGVPHQVLNAKYHEREAHIIAQAGRYGAVTIATNMAGRGTDIVLGGNAEYLAKMLVEEKAKEEQDEEKKAAMIKKFVDQFRQQCKEEQAKVREQGGLYVIGTERHESRRIDNQLRGRQGRQGDPGSSRFYISLEDDLMRLFGSERIIGIMNALGMEEGQVLEHPLLTGQIEGAQKRVEQHNFEIRKHLLEYDDVMNRQREVIYDMRRSILDRNDASDVIYESIDDIAGEMVAGYLFSGAESGWDISGLEATMQNRFGLELPSDTDAWHQRSQEALTEVVTGILKEAYKKKEETIEPGHMRHLERMILLHTIDAKWKDHLYAMDQLKEGIGLRSYAQRDPLIEFKREAFEMFQMMYASIKDEVVEIMFKIKPTGQETRMRSVFGSLPMQTIHNDTTGMASRQAASQQAAEHGQGNSEPDDHANTIKNDGPKVGRNDPCPCGSGLKYKKCHGK